MRDVSSPKRSGVRLGLIKISSEFLISVLIEFALIKRSAKPPTSIMERGVAEVTLGFENSTE